MGTEEPPEGHYVNDYDTYVPPGHRHNVDYFYQVLKDEHSNPFVYSSDPSVVDGNEDGELPRSANRTLHAGASGK
jgi:hypothetical protein